MKKLLFLSLALCLSFMALEVRAQDTDIKNFNNIVYIEPVTVNAGSTYTLSVKMKNSKETEGFQFDLFLPEGMEFDIDEDGFPKAYLSEERTNARKTNTFESNVQPNGCLRTFGASSNGSVIDGNDGEIARITIKIASTLPEGDYIIKMEGISISGHDNAQDIADTEKFQTTITVLPPIDSRIILDETSTTIPEAATGVEVRVKRTLVADVWNTIVLPFSMTSQQMVEAFGDGVQLADFTGCETTYDVEDDEKVASIKVNFAQASSIEANHPYIIKVKEAISQFAVDGVDICPEEASVDLDPYVVGKGKTAVTFYNSFIGTYVANTVVPCQTLFLSGNKFWYSTGNTLMKAFRAYFDFYDLLPDVEEAETKICFAVDGNLTDIAGIVKPQNLEVDVYNMQGMRLGKDVDMNRLPKGIYIVNGKKQVIK